MGFSHPILFQQERKLYYANRGAFVYFTTGDNLSSALFRVRVNTKPKTLNSNRWLLLNKQWQAICQGWPYNRVREGRVMTREFQWSKWKALRRIPPGVASLLAPESKLIHVSAPISCMLASNVISLFLSASRITHTGSLPCCTASMDSLIILRSMITP